MSIRTFDSVPYMPILCVRPAEMNALEELPAGTKDRLLPYVLLGPWTTAHQLDSALARIQQAYDLRPIVFDLAEPEPYGARRPVHHELDQLRNSANGYDSWRNFIAQHENVIPAIQIADPNQILTQIQFFAELDREVVIRLPQAAMGQTEATAQLIAAAGVRSERICFLFDYEKATADILTRLATIVGLGETLHRALPGCFISVSASSFPEAFENIEQQEIYERRLFNEVKDQLASDRVFYSDRGSARAERQSGGGGQPWPRIDYASNNQWAFFREEVDDPNDPSSRHPAYVRAANRATGSPGWDARLRIWGTQMIERTALGHTDAITSPMRCTSARINIHLHRQTCFDLPQTLYDTDDDWHD